MIQAGTQGARVNFGQENYILDSSDPFFSWYVVLRDRKALGRDSRQCKPRLQSIMGSRCASI